MSSKRSTKLPEPDYLTLTEAAQRLGTTEDILLRLAAEGKTRVAATFDAEPVRVLFPNRIERSEMTAEELEEHGLNPPYVDGLCYLDPPSCEWLEKYGSTLIWWVEEVNPRRPWPEGASLVFCRGQTKIKRNVVVPISQVLQLEESLPHPSPTDGTELDTPSDGTNADAYRELLNQRDPAMPPAEWAFWLAWEANYEQGLADGNPHLQAQSEQFRRIFEFHTETLPFRERSSLEEADRELVMAGNIDDFCITRKELKAWATVYRSELLDSNLVKGLLFEGGEPEPPRGKNHLNHDLSLQQEANRIAEEFREEFKRWPDKEPVVKRLAKKHPEMSEGVIMRRIRVWKTNKGWK